MQHIVRLRDEYRLSFRVIGDAIERAYAERDERRLRPEGFGRAWSKNRIWRGYYAELKIQARERGLSKRT
jgi:hypothetical protein